jgi:hypothetical protein
MLLRTAWLAQAAGTEVKNSDEGIRGLAVRLLGDQAAEFVFEIIPAERGRDVFELESRDG